MSFLKDKYKTDFFGKTFSKTEGISYNQINSVEQFENSTTFKKFATIIPRLNGTISSITIELKFIYPGVERNKITIQARDSSGKVFGEKTATTAGSVYFSELPDFSAFEKIEFYFKNEYDISGKYATAVPESIRFSYHIKENPDYFLVKSE